MRRMAEGMGVILVASVLFGAMAVCVRAATAVMPPMQVALVRFAGALALLLATGGLAALRPKRAPLRWLVFRGLLGATAISLWFHGIRDAGAAVATMLHATYPVWATVLAIVLLGERFSWRIGVALAIQLAGVALVMGPEAGVAPHALRGAVLSLVAGMLAGAAVTTARQLRSSESATVITSWFMLTGMAVTLPSALGGAPPAPSWALIGALAGIVVASAAGQWLLHHGLGFTSAAQGSLAAATSIVTAALLESAWLGGGPRGHLVAGGSCMVAAVALAASAAVRPAAADRAPRPFVDAA
jgi:drug/metabolite transporter (DMT)-like permease